MLRINDQELNEIRKFGELDYPYECCGLMIGTFNQDGSKNVSETYAISNSREEEARRNRFLITPDELIRGERYARSKELDVVGLYHSHPDAPAVPSQYDLDHAWPAYSYIIVSVVEKKATDLFSWEMEPDRSQFKKEEMIVSSPAQAEL
ncbi:MAG: Mov34/MPN/PAD-1 family protein [Pyrinomonadaceae bacterium]